MFSNSGFQGNRQDQSVKKYEAVSYLADEKARQSRLVELKNERSIIWAFGRIRLVTAVISHRHEGPCWTDDGVVYSDLMLPYAVELAHLRSESNFGAAMPRFRYWLPKYFAEIGRNGMQEEWDRLCGLRSFVTSSRRVGSGADVLWMPGAEKIRDDLRLTRAERDAINATYPEAPPIRTVGVIDPLSREEQLEVDRVRQEKRRRAMGVKPMASRTLTADTKALADVVGCNEKTIRRHRDAGTLTAWLARKGVNVQNPSAQYILEIQQGQVLDIPDDDVPDAEVTALLNELVSDHHGWAMAHHA